jgi:polyhydroxybutyrate depolymerase
LPGRQWLGQGVRVLRRYGLPALCLALVAGVTTISSGAEAAPPPGCARPAAAGVSTQTITVGTAKRNYLLAVPQSATTGGPLPVIMGLHGGSDTAQNAFRYMGLAGARPALYVFPQAPYWPEAGGVGWNVDPNGVDFPYFDALLADLGNKYCVDAHRVFATGMSNGGFMVNSLACFRPGMLRAIAPVAGGGPQTSRCPGTKPGAAVMIVHGSADRTVPIGSAQWSLTYWLWRNGSTSAQAKPTTPAPCVAYQGTAVPVLWCQHSGGHQWPTWTGPAVVNFFLSL